MKKCLLLFLTLIVPLVLAYEQSNTNFNINISVISGGGENQTNANHQINSLIGILSLNQTTVNYQLEWGFFYYVPITGRIEEKGGTITGKAGAGPTAYIPQLVECIEGYILTKEGCNLKPNITLLEPKSIKTSKLKGWIIPIIIVLIFLYLARIPPEIKKEIEKEEKKDNKEEEIARWKEKSLSQ